MLALRRGVALPRRVMPRCTVFRSMSVQSSDNNGAQQETPSDRALYECKQSLTIRLMLSISVVNMFYWSSYIGNHWMYGDTVVQGIKLAGNGDPMWGYLGVAATGLIVYFTRQFAYNTVARSYLSADQKRIGFQVHNLFGEPGRKFEVPIGNAKFLSSKQLESIHLPESASPARSIFNSSMLPLRIQGVESNVLIDKAGLINGSEETAVLLDLLRQGEHGGIVVSKEDRTKYVKSMRNHNKSNRKNH